MLTRTSSQIEPRVGARPNPLHPLARRLVGSWLLSEGTGRIAYDASGYRHDGGFSGAPQWSSGAFGHAVEFDGSDDWISMGDCLDLGTDDLTVLAIVRYSVANQPDNWSGSYLGAIAGKGFLDPSRGYGLLVDTSNQICWQVRSETSVAQVVSDAALNDGRWHVAVAVCDRDNVTGVGLYVDGVRQIATADPTSFNGVDLSSSRPFSVGSRQGETGVWYWDFAGSVAAVCVWKRLLSESEIRHLQCDPFALFAGRRTPVYLAPRVGGVIDLAGSIEGVSDSYGTLRRTRNLAGTTGSVAGLYGRLSVSAPPPECPNVLTARMPWLGEALFHGVTRTAFQLGTALTQGWFWVRREGCTVVYRGADIEQVDFRDIVHVAEPSTPQLLLPGDLPHPPDSAHCYLVRRFNSSGRLEQTMSSAVTVHIGPDGDLAPPVPNAVFGLQGEQVSGGLQLLWFHCPVDQHAPPGRFNVYWDQAGGVIDFENPVAIVPYEGRRSCGCRIDALTAGRYQLAVRAESRDGVEGPTSRILIWQITTTAPEMTGIPSIEAL